MSSGGKITHLFDFNSALRQDEWGGEETKKASSPSEAEATFRRELVTAGYRPSSPLIGDGTIHRCDGPGDKPGKKSGWYIFHNDQTPVGIYGSHKTGEQGQWSLRSEVSMSEHELAAYRLRVSRLREARDAEIARAREEAAAKASKIVAESDPVEAHPYLERKQVPALGDPLLNHGRLALPMFGVDDGALHSVQFIDAAGNKKFLTGGRKQGTAFTIPGGPKVAVAEGYATGASVHQATGWTVLVAFDCGNLEAVATAYRRQHPTADIIICGDEDRFTPGNPGRTHAEAAAKAASAKAIFPEFPSAAGAGTDWNDLHVAHGLDAVRAQLAPERSYRVRVTDWTLSRFTGEPPARQWLVKDTIPMGAVTILAAMGDAGKGLLGLDLALRVGSGPRDESPANTLVQPNLAFGNEVCSFGPTVLLLAEDDEGEVHRRLHNLGMTGKEQVYPIPLPNAGGPMPFIVPGKNGPEVTAAWHEMREQLIELKPALIIVDPLASFVMADVNADPAAGAFTTGLFASLATETGAAVIVAHHLAKAKGRIGTPEEARSLVRGSTALVDGSRSVYVLWQEEEKRARQVCQTLGVTFMRNRVFHGCVVKANGPADREIKTYVRDDHGLLRVRDFQLTSKARVEDEENLALLERVIAWAASVGHPFTVSGKGAGLFENKERLPKALRAIPKHKLQDLANRLLDDVRVVKCRAEGSKADPKWLDVPGGAFATGAGTLQDGEAPRFEGDE